MNSLRNLIIMFAVVLLLLVGGVLLLGNPGDTEDASLLPLENIIVSKNIDTEKIMSCVQNGDKKDVVDDSIAEAKAFELSGTPGVILYNKNTQLGVIMRGNYPLPVIAGVINGLLNEELTEGVVLYDAPQPEYTLTLSKLENVALKSDDVVKGSRDAKILMIEYSDYDCQYCAAFQKTAQSLFEQFSADLVWAYRQFPLYQIHPGSLKKTYIALCIKDYYGEDTFWEVTDAYLDFILKSE